MKKLRLDWTVTEQQLDCDCTVTVTVIGQGSDSGRWVCIVGGLGCTGTKEWEHTSGSIQTVLLSHHHQVTHVQEQVLGQGIGWLRKRV